MDKRMIRYSKLYIEVDIKTLQAETRKFINDKNWLPHFNARHYEGGWEVLPLRSPGGLREGIIPDLIKDTWYSNTSLMEEFLSVEKLIDQVKCPVMSVRLLNLKAGAIIRAHRDPELYFEKGEARIHFPVFTNPQVEFFVDNDQIKMKEGECWYINANRTHRVSNLSSTDRIHLVIDCQVNDWLKNIFEKGEKVFAEENEKDEELQKIIMELRLQNTQTSNSIADSLSNQLGIKKTF